MTFELHNVFTPEHDVYSLSWERGPDGLRPVVTTEGEKS